MSIALREASPTPPGSSEPGAGPDFKALIKASLAELVKENPALFQQTTVNPPAQETSMPSGSSGKQLLEGGLVEIIWDLVGQLVALMLGHGVGCWSSDEIIQ